MTKSKSNALDTLRTLIAERQQYDQWIVTLESKRDGTPEHVFNRVLSDYRSRLERVLGEIRSHSEELQLSITALSARLGEVAKDEEAKRDSIQEAELRAAVGEYDVEQWESMRTEAGRQLERIAADRVSLESQLAELESIRKLSEVTTGPDSPAMSTPAAPPRPAPSVAPPVPYSAPPAPSAPPVQQRAPTPESTARPETASPTDRPRFSDTGWPTRDLVDVADTKVPSEAPQAAPPPGPRAATPASSQKAVSTEAPTPPPEPISPPRRRTPTGKDAQISSGFTKPVPTPPEGRPEVNKTLKCPECGTANYPTEWYCERCGGELATM